MIFCHFLVCICDGFVASSKALKCTQSFSGIKVHLLLFHQTLVNLGLQGDVQLFRFSSPKPNKCQKCDLSHHPLCFHPRLYHQKWTPSPTTATIIGHRWRRRNLKEKIVTWNISRRGNRFYKNIQSWKGRASWEVWFLKIISTST